jgi:PHP family Zn ribbon phosphoesterase
MAKSIEHDKSIRNKSFNPEKYGMTVCPDCKSNGYILNPERHSCPKCGGFGFIKKEKGPCNNETERD